jgi:hypothetical protein
MMKNKFLMLVVALAMLVAMTGVVMAVSDSDDVVVIGNVIGYHFNIDVAPSTIPVTLDKTVLSGSPQSIAVVNVNSNYPDTWNLVVSSETGFMYDSVNAKYLYNPAQVGYNSVWHNMAIATLDVNPHTADSYPVTTGIGNSGPLDIWFNQPMNYSDPDDGNFAITLTFTGGWL